jgi:alkylated DNA nucleotide flippase Atl1
MDNSFTKGVYTITKNIPKGKVVIYKQLAYIDGNPKTARVVGMWMSRNPKQRLFIAIVLFAQMAHFMAMISGAELLQKSS